MRLDELRKGEKAVVTGLEKTDESLGKLLAMGLVPGVSVQKLAVFPCHVVAVGNSQIALDDALAGEVLVEKLHTKRR